MSETIESNQCHRAASGINIQRFGSASQNQCQRRSWIKTSWINGRDGRDGRDEGFFRVSCRVPFGFV